MDQLVLTLYASSLSQGEGLVELSLKEGEFDTLLPLFGVMGLLLVSPRRRDTDRRL